MQPDRITRTAEIAYIVLILSVAAIVWRGASALAPAPYDALGPKSFPIWVSYALAALGLAMLVRLLTGRSLGRAAQAMVVGLEDVMRERAPRPLVAVAMLILAFAYAATFGVRAIGFLPATAVYLFASGLLLGPPTRRHILAVAIFAVVAALLLDLVFRTIFKLDLA